MSEQTDVPAMSSRSPWLAAAVLLVIALSVAPASDVFADAGTASTQDAPRAVLDLKTLRKRAAQGDSGAQYELGSRYEDGISVKQDFRKAARLYYRAAQQGHAKAQNSLAYLYLKGSGVPQDYGEAYFWYALSLDPFDKGGASMLESIAGYLMPEQVNMAEKRLRRWKPVQEAADSYTEADSESANTCAARDLFSTLALPKRPAKRCKDAY
jgi:hypothetical protein